MPHACTVIKVPTAYMYVHILWPTVYVEYPTSVQQHRNAIN